MFIKFCVIETCLYTVKAIHSASEHRSSGLHVPVRTQMESNSEMTYGSIYIIVLVNPCQFIARCLWLKMYAFHLWKLSTLFPR